MLHICDGMPQRNAGQNFSSKYSCYHGLNGFEIEYADFEHFQNRNVYIKITRPEMLDKLNAMLAIRFSDAPPSTR